MNSKRIEREPSYRQRKKTKKLKKKTKTQSRTVPSKFQSLDCLDPAVDRPTGGPGPSSAPAEGWEYGKRPASLRLISGGEAPHRGMGQDVVAHVYDVATAGSDTTVLHINRFFKDAIGLGGIFHTAIQVIRFSKSHHHFLNACNARKDWISTPAV